jgi:hypothetical protein
VVQVQVQGGEKTGSVGLQGFLGVEGGCCRACSDTPASLPLYNASQYRSTWLPLALYSDCLLLAPHSVASRGCLLSNAAVPCSRGAPLQSRMFVPVQ